MSERMRDALRGNKSGRHWETIVGYTLSDLMRHIEALFSPGMSWDNFGEWHIDHVKPQALFRYESSDDAEFHECWALPNLQPLWAHDNLVKGARY